jgi:hypothetical protein
VTGPGAAPAAHNWATNWVMNWVMKEQNFRDLGGRPARGGALVAPGRIFRSGSWFDLTVDDINNIQRRVAIRSLVDLRTAEEIARQGTGPIEDPGVSPAISRRWIPLSDLPPHWWADAVGAADPGQKARRYAELLESSTAGLRLVFSLLADRDSYPAVFHCFAGKDRTGIVAALVLDLVGVDRSAIVADWFATADAVPEVTLRRAEFELFLQWFAGRYGTAQEFLRRRAALSLTTLRAVRANLLTP